MKNRNLLLKWSIWREQTSASLTKNKPAVIAACSLLLVLSLGTIVWSMLPESAPAPMVRYSYYYDLNTNELFVAKYVSEPPVDAPSGPLKSGAKAGVRAHVFACDSCDGDVWVGFLSMNRPLTSAEQKAADEQGLYPITDLIGDPQTNKWHLVSSSEAFKLTNVSCSDGQYVIECDPTEDEIANGLR